MLQVHENGQWGSRCVFKSMNGPPREQIQMEKKSEMAAVEGWQEVTYRRSDYGVHREVPESYAWQQ